MRFKDVVGHEKLKKELVTAIDNGRVAHAQLFVGKNGYGVLPLAIAYGQYLNCANKKDGDSCGECPSCYKYGQLWHPDLHFVYPINKSPHSVGVNSEGEVVSLNLFHKWKERVEQSTPVGYFNEADWYKTLEISKNSQGIIAKGEAHDLISKLSFKSVEDGYKVVIIWMAEQMNDASANGLLKLFEEPSDKTLFLFIATDMGGIIKTVLSRTQHTFVHPIDKENIYNHLIESGVVDTIALKASQLCEGDLCRAYDLVEQLESGETSDNFDNFATLMRLCFAVNHLGLMEWAESMSSLPKEEFKSFLAYSISLLRGGYIKNIGMDCVAYYFPYEEQFLDKFAPFVHHDNVESLCEEFEKCNRDLSQNANAKITITHFTMAISKLIRKP